MTEIPSGEASPGRKGLKSKVLRTVGAGALVAASFGSGAAYNQMRQPERLTLEQVQDQIQTHEHAREQAAILTRQINATAETGGTASVTVLNGVVTVKDSANNVAWDRVFMLGGLYKTSPQASDDGIELMLKGQWIGLQSIDSEGKVSIMTLPYDTETMRFEAFDRDKVVESLDVRAFPPRKGGGDTIAYTAYAVDPADPSQRLQDSDGSFVMPGRLSGTK